GPDVAKTYLADAQTKVDIIEGHRQLTGVQATELPEERRPEHHAGGRIRSHLMGKPEAGEVSGCVTVDSLVGVACNPPDAQNDPAMLKRPVGVEQLAA